MGSIQDSINEMRELNKPRPGSVEYGIKKMKEWRWEFTGDGRIYYVDAEVTEDAEFEIIQPKQLPSNDIQQADGNT